MAHHALTNEAVLAGIFSFLPWQGLCTAALVCSTWKRVADAHPAWTRLCSEHMVKPDALPKRMGLGEHSTYSFAPPGPSQLTEPTGPAEPPGLEGAKHRFRSFWTACVQLGVLEAVLGRAVVRNRSAQAWTTFTAKEEEQGIKYPAAVKNLLCIEGISSLALALYPTNNYLELSGKVWTSPPHLAHIGQHFMRIINENQGCGWWYVLFNPGQEDPPVFLSESWLEPGGDGESEEDEPEGGPEEQLVQEVVLQDPSFSHFWVTYLTEGLDWHKQNRGYLDAETRELLQEVHPWLMEPGAAAADSDDPDSDEAGSGSGDSGAGEGGSGDDGEGGGCASDSQDGA